MLLNRLYITASQGPDSGVCHGHNLTFETKKFDNILSTIFIITGEYS